MVVDAASVGSSGDMERFLTARVHDSLGQFLYADASFFCERLHAAAPCEVRVASSRTLRPSRPPKGCWTVARGPAPRLGAERAAMDRSVTSIRIHRHTPSPLAALAATTRAPPPRLGVNARAWPTACDRASTRRPPCMGTPCMSKLLFPKHRSQGLGFGCWGGRRTRTYSRRATSATNRPSACFTCSKV
jgi:hypothetical protein